LNHLLKIGELVKKTNVTKETIRYYERLDLLRPPSKDSNGYRLYSEQDVETIHYIKIGKALGFTLAEIKLLLYDDLLRDDIKSVQTVVDHKLDKLNQDIQSLLDKRVLLNGLQGKLKSLSEVSCDDISTFISNLKI